MILIEYTNEYGYDPKICPYAADVERSWVENEAGTASFFLPATTPNLLSVIRYGNLISIIEAPWPRWVGTITEREWSDGGVTVRLKGAEWLLTGKPTGASLAFPAGSVDGTIARGIVQSAYIKNNPYQPIRLGIFDANRPRFIEPLEYADCWETLTKLAEDGGSSVWVDEDFFLHFRRERGTNKTAAIKLFEGSHLVEPRVVESIEDALTAGIAIGAEKNNVSAKSARRLQTPLGYFRAFAKKYDKLYGDIQLRDALQKEIEERAAPRKTVDVDFVKTNLAEFWGIFFIGDTIELNLLSYNPEGLINQYTKLNVKIIGLEISGEDKVRMVMNVVPEAPSYIYEIYTPVN